MVIIAFCHLSFKFILFPNSYYGFLTILIVIVTLLKNTTATEPGLPLQTLEIVLVLVLVIRW